MVMKRLILVLSITVCFIPLTSQAIELGGVGGHPAVTESETENTRQWFVYTLGPGQSKDDVLEVANNTDSPVTVKLYPADSTPSSDGAFALKQAVEPQAGIGSWITMSQSEITLEPLSSELVPFTISIPSTVTLPAGEQTGGIVIQPLGQVSTTAEGLTISTRVGVRVYVNIPGTVVQQLSLQEFSVTPVADHFNILNLTMSVINEGTISQNLTEVVDIDFQYSWMRWLHWWQDYPIHQESQVQALPGQTLVNHWSVKRPWLGKLVIKGQAVYPTSQGQQVLQATPIVSDPYPVWQIILLVGIGILFLVLVWVRHKRQRIITP